MDKLIEKIKLYQPWTDEETWEKNQILTFAEKNPDCLLRANKIAHFTASAWVVNPERTKVVMAYHNIFDSWAWVGGHADGEQDLAAVALREAGEETGLKNLKLVSEEIFSLETIVVEGHVKRGSWVPSHLHLNLTFLAEAHENEELHMKADENSGVRWFTFEEALAASKEPWMCSHIYKKLINKVRIRG